MDFAGIGRAARQYEGEMTRFLRELIALPGESAGE